MINIYRASAGSGKTYTLAYQYIKMLLGRQQENAGDYRLARNRRLRHRAILAITFTNKATEEMKHRIVHELAVLAGTEPGWADPSPYLNDLCRDLHASPDQIRDEARRALTEILFDYGLFAVSTIDSFFQQVLRTFAREADLTGNYEVEIENDTLIYMAIANLFRSLEHNDDPKAARQTMAWLTSFLSAQLLSGEDIEIFNRRSQLFTNLHAFVKKAMDEDFVRHAEEITDYLADHTKISRFAAAIGSQLAEAERRMQAAAARFLEQYGSLADFLGSYVYKKIVEIAARKVKDLGTSLPAVVDDSDKLFNKTNAKKRPDIWNDADLRAAGVEVAAVAVDFFKLKGTLAPIRQNIHFLGLLGDILRAMEALRRENNTLLLSDTNNILAKIIGDDDTPFLYERMGVWLEHFLIDEFQDTSRLQWDCLKPLLHEGLATDRDSLIIGDEKQCIYRFRSSDPTLLGHGVRDDFPDPRDGNGTGANTNWRSSRTVVEFNNEFFTRVAANCKFDDIYSNVVQEISPAHDSHLGYVDIHRTESSKKDDCRQEGYARMAEHIARQINEGGYDPSDIAILCRKTATAVGAISYLLSLQATDPEFPRFRIISDESICIGSAATVKLIISVLRAILLSRPADDTLMSSTEKRDKSYTLGKDILARFINDFEFFSRTMTADEALDRAVKASWDGRSASVDLTDLDPLHSPTVDTSMPCPNLQTLVDRIITAIISPEELSRDHIYISALQDLVAEYTEKNGSDLRGFIEWWDASGKNKSVSAPQAKDTLRVMTIHKSKGLEFKCVHIPDANWEVVKFRNSEWFDAPASIPGVDPEVIPPLLPMKPSSTMLGTVFEDQYNRRVRELVLDEMNVMYVAFTRAVDELIVTYSAKESDKKKEEKMSTNAGNLFIAPALALLGSTDGNYISGEPTTRRQTKAGKRTALEPEEVEEIPLVISEDKAESWAQTRIDLDIDPLTPRGRGIMLHDVLSQVATSADLPRAVRRMMSRGIVPRAMARDVEAFLADELRREDVKGWFEGYHRVMTERPIAVGDGDEHRRPDRVVWTADGTVDVIDYKSGEERPAAHRRQVSFYMNQLRKLGYERVRGFLWYLDSGEIIQVS